MDEKIQGEMDEKSGVGNWMKYNGLNWTKSLEATIGRKKFGQSG